jgi:hypothetical protein
VTVYSLAPPTSAERMLRIHDRLHDKLRVAQRAIGVAGRILPAALTAPEPLTISPGIAERSAAIDRRLREWANAPPGIFSAKPVVSAAIAPVRGFIAAVVADETPTLVADVGDGITTDVASIEHAMSLAVGRDCRAPSLLVTSAVDRIGGYLQSRRGAESIDFSAGASARARRVALERLAQTLARTPRYRRAIVAPLADAVRAVTTASLGEGAERILETLVRADLPDEAWLKSIATFGELHARHDTRSRPGAPTRIVAVIVFVRL